MFHCLLVFRLFVCGYFFLNLEIDSLLCLDSQGYAAMQEQLSGQVKVTETLDLIVYNDAVKRREEFLCYCRSLSRTFASTKFPPSSQ